jgi:type II secretory ATPase GspE/PulE/Tfp pilus assembly ATPase PilB-like protein
MSTYIKKTQKEELSEAPQVEELLKNLEFHNAIQSITGRIASAQTLREILVDIKEDIRTLFNIHILTIYLIDKTRKEIYTLNRDGSEIRFPIDFSTFPGWVAQKKKMLHIADAYNDREIRIIHDTLTFDRTLDKKTGVLTGQIIASPILREGLILGVMEILNKKGGDKIDDYNQIFLDEITGVLAKAFFLHLNVTEARQIYGARFESLVQKGVLTSEQMDKAIKETTHTRRDLATVLMDAYHIAKADIGTALSNFYSCPFTQYNKQVPVPADLLIGIEKSTLVQMLWTPLKVVKGKIHVLINDPADFLKKRKIEEILETSSVQYEVSLAEDILQFISRFYETQEEEDSVTVSTKQPSRENRIVPGDIALDAPDIEPISPSEESKTARGKMVSLKPVVEFSDEDGVDPEIKKQIEALEFGSNTASVFRPAIVAEHKPVSLPASRLESVIANSTARGAAENKISSVITAKSSFSDIDDLTEIKSHRLKKQPLATDFANDQMPQPLANIVYDAYSRRATDIHFEPDPVTGTVTVRLRIEGQFLSSPTLTDSEYERLIGQLKKQAQLNIQDRYIIQEGRLTLQRPSGNDIFLQATFIPTRNGMEDTVIHISTRLKKIPLELMGLSENNYTSLVNILRQPRGLILIVGQPHSGITTTLHACLDNINTREMKIWTAEEPVEIIQSGLRQVDVNPQKGFDFPTVLRSFLKADPDAIMASRISNAETATICMQAAIQGRLVLGSLGSENILDAIERCLDMGVDPLIFADAMLAISEQRLIHTLCLKCKEKYHPSLEEYNELAQIYGKDAFDKLNIPYTNAFCLFRPKGCVSCGQTGYAGRMCVSEIFIFTPQIKRMIRRKESPQTIYEAAVASGMITLMQDGLLKVLQGHCDSRHARLACLKL